MIDGVEWRLVAIRPAGQEGRDVIVPKRDAEAAAKALRNWRRDMSERYEPNGLDVWSARVETREVGEWTEVPEAELEHERERAT